MFNWLSSTQKKLHNLQELQWDVHCHLLPGIDDGPENMEESVEMIKFMKSLGYKGAVCTSHIFPDVYDNHADDMKRGVDKLQEELIKQNIDFKLHASAEYMIDSSFIELAKSKSLLAFGKENYILMETGFTQANPYFDEAIYEVQCAGYSPILAHPERYGYLINGHDIQKYEEIFDKGIEMQINLFSLLGKYGRPSQLVAEKLLNKGYVQWIGSDIHRLSQIPLLEKVNHTKTLHSFLKKQQFYNLNIAEYYD